MFGDTLQEVDGNPLLLYNISPQDCQGQQHSEPMAILYSYKMSHDDRFAPNPYFGVLTLATCMSRMRYNTPVGDWIAGWTSKHTSTSTEVGGEQLIYLANVSEKLTFAEYWDRYPSKRPGAGSEDNEANEDTLEKTQHGDNIYRPYPNAPSGLVLVDSVHRRPTDGNKIAKDIAGRYVLVCKEYYFFGAEHPLAVPPDIRPNVPKYQSSYGNKTADPTSFIDYVRAHARQCVETSLIINR